MVEVANGGKLPIESRKAFFHAVGELEETTLNRIECAAERVMLLDDDYGAQAVLSLLNEDRADDAAVLAARIDGAEHHVLAAIPGLLAAKTALPTHARFVGAYALPLSSE